MELESGNDRLKTTIDDAYPLGWFVAVVNGQVVACSASFHALEMKLIALGHDPRRVLVVEAGAKDPDHVTIYI
jgi:hypothetical protein